MKKCPKCKAEAFMIVGDATTFACDTFMVDGTIREGLTCRSRQLAAIESRLAKDKNGKTILPGMIVVCEARQYSVFGVAAHGIVIWDGVNTASSIDAIECEIVEHEP